MPLRAGSRFKTFHDFGFVILEISNVYAEDTATYTCRAYNDYGEAVISSVLTCSGKRTGLILDSQLNRLGLDYDKIAALEGLGSAKDRPSEEDDGVGRPPELTPLADIEIVEGALAHFECRLTPVNIPTRVEWFHNGKPINHGSRTKCINDFGFSILEIGGIMPRDTGVYVCKVS